MKKLLLLCALLSFNINATIAVLDSHEIEKTITNLLPSVVSGYFREKFKNDVAEWAKEAKEELVIVNSGPLDMYPYPCIYFSQRMDGTQKFIDWLKKKYTCSQCLFHCQNLK